VRDIDFTDFKLVAHCTCPFCGNKVSWEVTDDVEAVDSGPGQWGYHESAHVVYPPPPGWVKRLHSTVYGIDHYAYACCPPEEEKTV